MNDPFQIRFMRLLLSTVLTVIAPIASANIFCSKVLTSRPIILSGDQTSIEAYLLQVELPPKESWVFIGDTNDRVFRIEISAELSVVWRGSSGDKDHEVAAYQVDRLFGFNVVPVTVRRKFDNQWGSLQLFAKNMSEAAVKPPPILVIFDYLIGNEDRGVGHNFFLTKKGQPVAFDHENSFQADLENFPISQRELKLSVERLGNDALVSQLRSLSARQIRKKLSPYLSADEIDGLLRRRNQIVRSALRNLY